MLAMSYCGPYRVRAANKPDFMIEHPNDAIIQVLPSCICGSDLHLYHGLVPDTRVGTTFGHEFVGTVVDVSSVQNLGVGDRVLVPFNVFRGSCYFCQRELYGNCHNTNPQATAVGGIYGYSHTAGDASALLLFNEWQEAVPFVLPAAHAGRWVLRVDTTDPGLGVDTSADLDRYVATGRSVVMLVSE